MSEAATTTDTPGTPMPFLPAATPHWVIRGLATLLIGIVFGAGVLAAAIRLPETVSSPFLLVPIHGTDPVRASRGGVVTTVAARDAELVAEGARLFVVQSSPVGDRSAELATLDAELAGARAKLENEQLQYESRRLGDRTELEKQKSRVRELGQIITLKHHEQTLTTELLARYEKLREKGFSSRAEAISHELEANRTATELHQAELDRAEAAAAVEKLGHEMTMREAEHVELERSERERVGKSEIRAKTLRAELGSGGRSDLAVVAPCSGVVLRSRVRAPGAVVAEGAVLAEIACSGGGLEAELSVPPTGAGRLQAGEVVKLLYDAFPYQRYGVRYGRLRWVSPAAVEDAEKISFRALADVDDDAIIVDGQRRPLLAGMGGQARIVIGRRSLLSYAFAPIRQLRESIASGPSAARSPKPAQGSEH